MEETNYEPIKFIPRITAQEAREISNKNTKTTEDIDKETIGDIVNKITKDAELGGTCIYVSRDWVNAKIKIYFEAMGFKVEFKKGLTLMDADQWQISW